MGNGRQNKGQYCKIHTHVVVAKLIISFEPYIVKYLCVPIYSYQTVTGTELATVQCHGPWYNVILYVVVILFLLVGQEREGPAHHSLHHWPGADL
jgi:hypothetical protein